MLYRPLSNNFTQSRSVSNISNQGSQPTEIRLPPQSQITAIWDVNQIGQELDCKDDPALVMALELISSRQVNQALQMLHQVVTEGKKYLGQQSHFQQVSQVILVIVSSAMSLLETEPSSALLLLLGCEQLIRGLTAKQQGYLRVQVQNGLGCYYRRVGQLDKSLKEMEVALALIRKFMLNEVAITYLNLSVILSLIEDHDGALENAKKAVIESNKEYQHYIKNHISMSQFKFQRCVSALAIAFYNIGVQEQYFQKYQQALQAYASAFKVAEDNLGQHNYLTIQLKNIYEEFARQLAIAEAQKLSVQSLNHKFFIKINQKKLIQTARPTSSTAQKEILIQTVTKSAKVLRPQSAITLKKNNLSDRSVGVEKQKRQDSFSIRKPQKMNNYILTEEKVEPELLIQSQSLKDNILSLKQQAEQEKQMLMEIQAEKQKQISQLQSLMYVTKSIRGQTANKLTSQTSRESKDSIDKFVKLDKVPNRQSIATLPEIQLQALDDSDAQPLIAGVNSKQNSQSLVDDQLNREVSEFNHENQQINEQIDGQQEFDENLVEQISPIEEFEIIQEESPEKQIPQEQANYNIVINQVSEIFDEKQKEYEEHQQEHQIILIQRQWRFHKNRFQDRVHKLTKSYIQTTIDQNFKIESDQHLHQGLLISGLSSNEIIFIFIDFTILRKSTRKPINVNSPLKHTYHYQLQMLRKLSDVEYLQYIQQMKSLITLEQNIFQLSFGDSKFYILQSQKFERLIIKFDQKVLTYFDVSFNHSIETPKLQEFSHQLITLSADQPPVNYSITPFQRQGTFKHDLEDKESEQYHQIEEHSIVQRQLTQNSETYTWKGDTEKSNKLASHSLVQSQSNLANQNNGGQIQSMQDLKLSIGIAEDVSQPDDESNQNTIFHKSNKKSEIVIEDEVEVGEDEIHHSQKEVVSQFKIEDENNVDNDIPDIMGNDEEQGTEEESEDSEDIQEDDINNYETIGSIVGLNKINISHVQIQILLNKSTEKFIGRVAELNLYSHPFKVEKLEKTIKKPQKYLKGYIIQDHKTAKLKVYTQEHEKAVVRLQKKFKHDHYVKHCKFKLSKQNIQGELFVGNRRGVIYLAVCTPSKQNRHSYRFFNENYRQFWNKIQFRIINNLKYSDDQGIFLLQEPEHKILAQNLQAKILQLSKPQDRFEFIGFSLLNAIYDIVHKKIIIASDNRKVEAAQMDIPKNMVNEQLVEYAQKLLNKSFIIQAKNELCVVYYEPKDVEMVQVLQRRLFNYKTIRNIDVNHILIGDGQLYTRQFKVELQQRLLTYYAFKCNDELFEIGKLSRLEYKKLLCNYRKIISIFSEIDHKSQITFNISDIQQYIKEGECNKMLRMDVKDYINYANQYLIQEMKIDCGEMEQSNQMQSSQSKELDLQLNTMQSECPVQDMYYSKVKEQQVKN